MAFKRSDKSFRKIFTILPGKNSISLHLSSVSLLIFSYPFLETFWNLNRKEITIGVVSVLPTGILVVPLIKVTLLPLLAGVPDEVEYE